MQATRASPSMPATLGSPQPAGALSRQSLAASPAWRHTAVSALLGRPARLARRAQRCRSASPSPGAAAESGGYGQRVLSPDSEGDIVLECDESGCVLVLSSGAATLDEHKDKGFLACTLTGCYYSPDKLASEFKVIEGTGWRLGYETAPASEDSFAAMVGAGGWSIALRAAEFHDFCRLVQMLRRGIMTMDQDGLVLGRDDIVLQVEKGSMWMECTVPKKGLPSLQKFLKFGGRTESAAFEIRFILTGKYDKRQAEGYWPAEAVMDMLRKTDELSRSPLPASGSGVTVSA